MTSARFCPKCRYERPGCSCEGPIPPMAKPANPTQKTLTINDQEFELVPYVNVSLNADTHDRFGEICYMLKPVAPPKPREWWNWHYQNSRGEWCQAPVQFETYDECVNFVKGSYECWVENGRIIKVCEVLK